MKLGQNLFFTSYRKKICCTTSINKNPFKNNNNHSLVENSLQNGLYNFSLRKILKGSGLYVKKYTKMLFWHNRIIYCIAGYFNKVLIKPVLMQFD